jgi:hypothetical protein
MAPPKAKTAPVEDDWMPDGAVGAEDDADWMPAGVEGEIDGEQAAAPTSSVRATLLPRATATPKEDMPAFGWFPDSAAVPALRGALDYGTLGFADEGVGLINRFFPSLNRTVEDVIAGRPAPAAMTYPEARDEQRALMDKSREENPAAYHAGGMATMFLPMPKMGPASIGGSRFLGSLAQGAAQGGLSGLGHSEAELVDGDPDVSGAVGDAFAGAGFGGVTSGVGYGVAQKAPMLLRALRGSLDSRAIDKARKVLTNGADQLSTRKPLPDAAVKEALDSGAVMPWGTTKGAFQRLETAAEWQGMTYADILERLEKQGVPGPRAQELATKFSHEAADRAANSGANKSVAKAFASEADNVRAVAPRDFVLLGESPPAAVQTPATPSAPPVGAPSKVPLVRDPMNGRYLPRALQPQTAPPPLVPDAIPAAPPAQPTVPVMYRKPVLGPQSPNLGLGQAERIKRALQADARYGRIEDTPVNEAKKEIASTYRQAIEDTIQQAGGNSCPSSDASHSPLLHATQQSEARPVPPSASVGPLASMPSTWPMPHRLAAPLDSRRWRSPLRGASGRSVVPRRWPRRTTLAPTRRALSRATCKPSPPVAWWAPTSAPPQPEAPRLRLSRNGWRPRRTGLRRSEWQRPSVLLPRPFASRGRDMHDSTTFTRKHMRTRIIQTAALAVGLTLGVILSFSGGSDAARNSSGTYSLASGNPVVSGTTISSVWANNTLSDLGSEITDSLSRSGKGPMLAPLQHSSGTSAAPSVTFSVDPDSGLYRNGSNDIRMGVDATYVQKWATSGASFPVGVVAPSANTAGLTVTGNGTGQGVVATGGATSGVGVSGIGGATNGNGVNGFGTGTGKGVDAFGGATSGTGVSANGGAPNGVGVTAIGSGTGVGVSATGGASGAGGTFTPGTAATASARATAITSNNGDIAFANVTQPNSTLALSNVITPKNVIKAWGTIITTGGGSTAATVQDGFNISSVTVAGSSINVNFASAFANTSYTVLVTPYASVFSCAGTWSTTSQILIVCRDISGAALPFPLENFQTDATARTIQFAMLGAQ